MAVSLDNRKEQEKKFHDTLRDGCFGQRWTPELELDITQRSDWANMKYYSIERGSRRIVFDWFIQNCSNKRVLDYCCGNGEDGYFIARNGAKEVIGIDISEISIHNCTKQAKELNLKNIAFKIMDAEELLFDDDYFDVITEYGALHHLDLEKAYAEIARALNPSGKAICVEVLGHNPIIQFYRRITPNLRTAWEVDHILRKKDIAMAEKYFKRVEVLGLFHLATLAAVPFRNTPSFENILGFLEKVDNVILKLPIVKWQAWQVVFVLSEPIKK